MGSLAERGFVRAAACAFALVLLVLLPFAVQARQILDLDVGTQPAQLHDWGDWLVDESGATTLRRVLARPDLMQPTPADARFHLRAGEVLWIRFTVPAAPDEQRWFVRLSDPALESVTLYTRRTDDSWSAQWSGTSYPISLWAHPHLYPVLPLSVSAAEPTNYMLRIEASEDLAVPVEFVSESRLSLDQQRLSLLYGVYFGLLAMGAIFSFATSAVQRDWSHFWFGAWNAVALLATATAAGVAGLQLWPESPPWNEVAHHVLPAAAGAPFMLFVLQVLAVRERAERIYWPCAMFAAAALGFAVLSGIAPPHARTWLSGGTVAGMALVSVAIAAWSWDHGEKLARRIVLAMLPFGTTLAVYAARNTFGAPFAQHALVILLAGMATTICAMYLLLASRTQSRRDSHRRVVQLQEIDPLTGLVNDTVFASRLPELVQRSQRFGHQSVVAVLDFTNFFQLRTEFGRKYSLEHLLRLAERLTAMMRTVDTVARLTETRFGLLVDGPVAPSRARALCAKVIAHCITPMSGLPLGMVMKPRIAMALVPMHGAKSADVMALLDRMLAESAADPSRIIIVPEIRSAAPAQPPPVLAESTLGSTLGTGTEFLPTSGSEEADQSR